MYISVVIVAVSIGGITSLLSESKRKGYYRLDSMLDEWLPDLFYDHSNVNSKPKSYSEIDFLIIALTKFSNKDIDRFRDINPWLKVLLLNYLSLRSLFLFCFRASHLHSSERRAVEE